jgi:hypothetical protein
MLVDRNLGAYTVEAEPLLLVLLAHALPGRPFVPKLVRDWNPPVPIKDGVWGQLLVGDGVQYAASRGTSSSIALSWYCEC